MANGVVIPCDGARRYESSRTYYTGSNVSVTVFRSGYMRQLYIWNCPRATVNSITLDTVDEPLALPYDTVISIRDASPEPLRIDGGRNLVVGTSGNNVMTSITYISHYNASQV